jgi:LuxR family transcriptional regulator, maltose regulon positive regulatory protein
MANIQPSLNKISRPRMADVVPRERLFSLMDQAFTRPIVWLSGPGGAGKSTLVASYLDSRNLPCTWYQVDEGDADTATLFYYLSLASAQEGQPQEHSLPLFTPEYQPGIATFARRYFENFFSRLKPPYVLVLDDYHEVGPESAFHEVIKYALSEVPQGVTIVVVSRQSPPATLARLCAGKQMSFVGWDELRLTIEETGAIVQMYDKKDEWNAALGQLHDKVQGWIAGLVLFLERGNIEEIGLWRKGKGTPEEIFNYFADELFNKTDARIQDFLLKSSLFPTIVPSLAERLTENTDATQVLAKLHSTNFFTEKRHDGEVIYRFHPLFREYLLIKAETAYRSDILFQLKRTASILLEESNRSEDAASLSIEAKDWDRLKGLILGKAAALTGQGRSRTVLEWLDHMPPSFQEHSPDLLYWMGACRMTSNFAEARVFFERAYPLFEALQDASGLYLTWSGVVDSLINEWADFSRLDVWLDNLNLLRRRYPCFPSREIEGKVAGSAFSALMFHMPQHPDIDSWSERILALVRESNDPSYRIMIGNQLGLYHLWWTGNHTKLSMVMDLLRPPDGDETIPPLAQIIWVTLRGFQEWALGFSEEALRTFAEGLHIANDSGVHVWDFMLYFQGIVSYLGEGDYRTGVKYLNELADRLDRSQHLNIAHYCYLAAWRAVLAGEIGHAQEHVQTAMKMVEHLGGPFTQAVAWAAWTQVQYLDGRRDEALVAIEKSIQLTRDIKSPLLTYRNLIVKAYFALEEGNETICLETLHEAFALGRERGYMNFSWWQKSIMIRLCMKALEAGIEVNYVRELISRRNLVPEKPPIHIEQWPWPLKIYTLGRFELMKADKTVEFSGKVQKKPLELLKALVALGGEESHEGQLADLLWPESDGDTARNSIKVTLHRLREVIGYDRAIQVREGRLVMDRSLFWTDAWAFEKLIIEAQLKRNTGEEAEAIQLTIKALSMYRGRFLNEDADKPWAHPLCKRLHNSFILNVIAMGNFFQARNDYKQAITHYIQGLDVDDLAEELYQNLMRCYLAAGLHAEAITTYQRCKKSLAISLGISPSAITNAIHENAMNCNLL